MPPSAIWWWVWRKDALYLTPAVLSYPESWPYPLPAATLGTVSSVPCLFITVNLTQYTKARWVTPRIWPWEIYFCSVSSRWQHGQGRDVVVPHPLMSVMAERDVHKVLRAEICSCPMLAATLRNEATVSCLPGQHRRPDSVGRGISEPAPNLRGRKSNPPCLAVL